MRMAAWSVIRKKGGAGIDHQTTEQLEQRLEEEVEMLSRQIQKNTYQPKPVKRVWIDKPGSPEKRPLGVPVVRDRTVQGACRAVIEPIFEHQFSEHSYGFRPDRSPQQAIERVEQLLEAGHGVVVDADIQKCFDDIPQEGILARVAQKISDGRILALIESFLKQGVMDTIKGWQPTDKGTPQGAVLSPLLANIYLDSLDHLMAQNGYEMVRYADDFIVLTRSQEEAQKALELIGAWMEQAGLTLHPTKTRIVDVRQRGGFDFLGWHFERGLKWPREKSVNRLKASLRDLTPRNCGQRLECVIVRINRRLRGWAGYFNAGVNNVYVELDKWLRMRMRSILRRRAKRKGRGRGRDHQRYPNAYFAERGLISLEALIRAKRSSPA